VAATGVDLARKMNWLLRIVVPLIASVLLAGSLAAQQPSRSVLVIDQSSVGLPFNTALAMAIRLTLNAGSDAPISFYAENLDANRFFGADYEEEVVSFFRKKYQDRPIDTIVVVGPAALDFIIRRRSELWPDVPVVFAAIDEATAARVTIPANFTGVIMQLTLQDMVTVARVVVPNLKRIAIVGDPLERQTFYRHFADEIPTVAKQSEIIDLMDLPMAELKKRLGTLPYDTAVIYTGIYYTSEGTSYVPAELVTQIAEWANRPVVINVASYLGKGAVGGYIVTPEPIGRQAAQLVLRILKGESASSIPVARVASPLIFEWPALQRFGVDEATLPPGSEVRSRKLSVWDLYRGQLLFIAAVLLIQTGLIIGLLYQRRRRREAEAASRGAMAKLAQMNRFATAGELTASIAHEVGQPLGSMVTGANAALRWLTNATPDLDEALLALRRVVNDGHRAGDVVKNAREMFKKQDLEKEPIDLNVLIQDVLGFMRVELQAHEILVETELSSSLPLVLGNKGQLQQAMLNLIRNAADAMDANSDRARVLTVKSIAPDPDVVRLSVEDSGTGVDPKDVDRIFDPLFTTKTQGMGMGLSICRSIINAHDGRLWASSIPNRGSIFNIQLPAIRRGGQCSE
jgi:signal transduction histidine kinase